MVATPVMNRLLAALSVKGRTRFIEGCDQVELVFGEVLVEAGERSRYVYFPTRSFISLVAALDDHARLEVGLVGDEGMLGTELILGVDRVPLHALVQGAGTALRMDAAIFRRELNVYPQLRVRLNRSVYVLTNQLAQAAICTRYHYVGARLARWLLMTRDRAHSDELHVTQELMAYMLGVRRVGVTKAAGALEALGLIQYDRGKVHILDGATLEEAACQCYRKDRNVYDRLLIARGPLHAG
jgi:CRP-like cAMP-binding protein